ncbi:tudor domain-containing protein 7-like isoform X2 [Dinothrombium tinctorium]|uniref:Tudor domain-containing protein 7-like isoform X2 n=1 Tax=Dinothrombium tinctorium TaxID=1965070 RepID=A0A3S3S5N7_9ACAR|nr:tudor domain-containing protein 7-like isoform X2 [Dinothrombium tinctorium]RWS09533.1 tudor domain-containing protein 7-like isoform X2 [Dinothrombium tinctorium]
MNADLNSVKIALRAVLQSAKYGLNLRRLEADYRELNGCHIPYRSFGYKSLEDFLRHVPDTVILSKSGAETIATYTQCEETAHIEKLVRGQKSSKKKPHKVNAPKPIGSRRPNIQGAVRRSTYAPRFFSTQNSKQKPQQQQATQAIPFQPSPQTRLPQQQVRQQPLQTPSPKPSSAQTSSPSQQTKPLTNILNDKQPALSKSFDKTNDIARKPQPLNHGINQVKVFDSSFVPPFSSYNTSVIPERTIVFENQTNVIKGSFITSTKPDMKITRRNDDKSSPPSYSSGSRPSSPSVVYKLLLRDLVQDLNLGEPKYRSLGCSDKKKSRVYYVGTVVVGNEKFNSYPATFSTPDEAEEEAAHKAYEALKPKLTLVQSRTDVTAEKNKLISNIIEILSEDRYNLMFHDGLEQKYLEKFKQRLPKNWLDIIETYPERFEVEKKEYTNKVVITVGIVKQRRKSSATSSTASPQTPPPTPNDFEMNATLDVQEMPESLVLPGTETWDIVITRVISANEVIMRLIEYDGDYVDLVDKLHYFYTLNPRPVENIVVGRLYAAKFDETTSRVHVQKIEDDGITCIFVDEGGEEKLPKNILHELDSSFLTLPFQAFVCQLADLKHFADSAVGKDYLETLITSIEDAAVVAVPTNREDPIEVKLYDTSNPEDLDLNDEMLKFLRVHYYDDLFKNGRTASVCVVNYTDSGDFYVQVNDPLYIKFETAQPSVNQVCNHKGNKQPTLAALKNQKEGVTCYALYKDDQNWYRVKIIDIVSENQIKIYYLDFGNEGETKISEIRLIDASVDPLYTIPYLAIKCRLDNVPKEPNLKWCQKTSEKYSEIVQGTELLDMKVIKKANETSPPLIELFLNVNADYIVVNMKLASCKEAFEQIEVKERTRNDSLPDILKPKIAPVSSNENGFTSRNQTPNSSQSTSRQSSLTPINGNENSDSALEEINLNASKLNISGDDNVFGSTEAIPEPLLPRIVPNPILDNDFFDVYVSLAATPSNFTVQTYESTLKDSQFQKLMEDMFNFYEQDENRIELHPDLIKPGQFICVKWLEDQYWYRVRVETICSRDPFIIVGYFVDYGDMHNIELKNVQPLFTQFRRLPMQALKASLADVTPRNDDWEVVACLEFSTLVKDKAFVATVKNIVQIDGKPVLQLTLCDTTGDRDTFIHDILVERGYAKYIT